MTIVVFGATGHLGRHVLAGLKRRGAPAADITAAGRDLSKLGDQNVRAVRVDYADAATVRAALRGGDRALLISGGDFGRRVAQHAAVIDAAGEAGVELLAYTSTPHAAGSGMAMAREHAATESHLRDSGVPFTVLRNSMYLDILTGQVAPRAAARGVVEGASGKGRISPASRAELGDAAAEVLVGEGHAGAVYELGGARSYTMDDVASAIARWSGRHVEYRDVPAGDYRAMLVKQGMPEKVAEIFADTQLGIARDEFYVSSGDLTRLIGRPSRTLEEALSRTATSGSSG
ncbi:NmrA family NAD(P)-binding protein [Actinacidiphila sp. bgisy144]|uniref:NmrA family NAD(P)-binding protein n=1 Tax=Actinacidiphila sp. bgisy144 TaxID=3413791 RepID=UPI003EBE501C